MESKIKPQEYQGVIIYWVEHSRLVDQGPNLNSRLYYHSQKREFDKYLQKGYIPVKRFEPDISRKIVDSKWLDEPVSHKEIDEITRTMYIEHKQKFSINDFT